MNTRPPHPLALDSCPECGRPIRRLLVTLESDPEGEPALLAVDPLPSIHGTIERTSLTSNDAIAHEHRHPGLLRPHFESCGSANA